jgi:hypothetical protein
VLRVIGGILFAVCYATNRKAPGKGAQPGSEQALCFGGSLGSSEIDATQQQ